MDNGIVKRQNEEKYIYHLAAQRQLYNEAKELNNIRIFFSVFVPVFFAVLSSIMNNNVYLIAISVVVATIIIIISPKISSSIEYKREKAAEIQQHFDLYVYQMPWDDKLFGLKRDVSNVIAEKSKLLVKSAKEREKLANWYTVIAGTVDLEKGILMCQKENYNWDVGLRKRFRRLCIITMFILIILILLIGIVKNEKIVILLSRIYLIVPIFQWLYETIGELNKNIKNLEELDKLINSLEPKNMDKLQKIQSEIYNHRKSCYIIPNIVYNKYKNNDEDVAHRTASMDK